MADRIMIDTVLLGDLQGQLRQLQRSLTTVNGKVVLSVSEVQRVASGQDAIIRKLQSIQRNVQKTADRTERLSRAVRDAVENWEEAEKKIASQKLPESADDSASEKSAIRTPTGKPTDPLEWISGVFRWIKQNHDASRHQRDIPYRINQMIGMLYHFIRQEEYSSGTINEVDYRIPPYNFEIFGETGYIDSGFAIWNNDHVSVTQQEIEIFGKKYKVYLPYISYGQGASAEPIHGKANGMNPFVDSYAEGDLVDGYIGEKYEIGFKDGKFVLHLGGGAQGAAASGDVGVNGKYVSVEIAGDVGSAGASLQIDYRDGVFSIDGLAAFGIGVDGKVSYNVEQYFSDWEQTVTDIAHGDYAPAAERLWDLLNISNPILSVLPNPISKVRELV